MPCPPDPFASSFRAFPHHLRTCPRRGWGGCRQGLMEGACSGRWCWHPYTGSPSLRIPEGSHTSFSRAKRSRTVCNERQHRKNDNSQNHNTHKQLLPLSLIKYSTKSEVAITLGDLRTKMIGDTGIYWEPVIVEKFRTPVLKICAPVESFKHWHDMHRQQSVSTNYRHWEKLCRITGIYRQSPIYDVPFYDDSFFQPLFYWVRTPNLQILFF